MRKFQYLVTVNLDDNFMAQPEVAKELKKMAELEGPDLVYALAEAKFPTAIAETLSEGIGDSGDTTIQVLFAGEDR